MADGQGITSEGGAEGSAPPANESLELVAAAMRAASVADDEPPVNEQESAEYHQQYEELNEEAEKLKAEIRETAAHLEGLQAMNMESMQELLGMRTGIEEELLQLKSESWRLQTVAELEAIKDALGDASDAQAAGATSSSGSNLEVEEMLRKLQMRLEMSTLEEGMGEFKDPEDMEKEMEQLDKELGFLDNELAKARGGREEMEEQRKKLEQEIKEFMEMAAKDIAPDAPPAWGDDGDHIGMMSPGGEK